MLNKTELEICPWCLGKGEIPSTSVDSRFDTHRQLRQALACERRLFKIFFWLAVVNALGVLALSLALANVSPH